MKENNLINPFLLGFFSSLVIVLFFYIDSKIIKKKKSKKEYFKIFVISMISISLVSYSINIVIKNNINVIESKKGGNNINTNINDIELDSGIPNF